MTAMFRYFHQTLHRNIPWYFSPHHLAKSSLRKFTVTITAHLDKTLTYASETSTLTKRDRKQLNIFERKVYRRILGPVYDNGKENWRILTNKEIDASLKKPTITETIRLHRLRWFGHVQRMEEDRIPKRVLYMNLETTRPRGRPRNRRQDEVREDGRMVGGEEWQEKVYDREEWKKLLRTARNRHSLHMAME
jgi:hypothetical protein